jgi:hypothetical protein
MNKAKQELKEIFGITIAPKLYLMSIPPFLDKHYSNSSSGEVRPGVAGGGCGGRLVTC